MEFDQDIRRTTRMREMAQDIAVVQPRHCELRDDHLEESRKGRKDTEFVCVETETSSSRKVSSLHDTRRYENLGVLLVNNLETCRTLKVT